MLPFEPLVTFSISLPPLRFHDVEPQEGLEALPPYKLSAKIVAGTSRVLPPPVINEDTLVLSEDAVVGHRDGNPFLMIRLVERVCLRRGRGEQLCKPLTLKSDLRRNASYYTLCVHRLGDTYPNGQVEDIQVKAYLYRWAQYVTAEGEELPYTVVDLPVHPATPSLR